MDLKLQRIGVWGGVAMMALLGLTFMVIAGLVPPPSPTATATETARFIAENKWRIRVGVALTALGAVLSYPWLAVICLRIRYVEGKWGLLSITQVLSAAVMPPSVVYPLIVMGAATYRPGHTSAETTQSLHDLFWLLFVCPNAPVIAQAVVLAIATFIDTDRPPTFPRWFGYLSIWFSVLSVPSLAALMFNDGPLAWNGVFAFWIPLLAFSVWIVALTVVLNGSIKKEQAAELTTTTARVQTGAVSYDDRRNAY